MSPFEQTAQCADLVRYRACDIVVRFKVDAGPAIKALRQFATAAGSAGRAAAKLRRLMELAA